MHRIATCAASAVLTLPGLVLGASPAHADDESQPAVLRLATNASVNFDRLVLLGATADGVIYVRNHVGRGGYDMTSDDLFRQSVGSAAEPLPRLSDGGPLPYMADVAGSMVVYKADDGTLRYLDTDAGEPGSASLEENQSYVGADPQGWLVGAPDEEATAHLYRVNATSGETTDLGAPPGWPVGGYASSVSDASGAVLTYGVDGGYNTVHVSYDEPGVFDVLDTDPEALAVACTDLVDDAVACVQELPGDVPPVVVRLPLDGTDATTFHPEVPYLQAAAVAMTADHVGWVTDEQRLATAPAAGGATTLGPTDVGQLASTGTEFVYTTGGVGSVAELRKIAHAGAQAGVVAAKQLSPVAAQSIAVGPGRVAWTDTATAATPVWSRTLSRSGTDVTAGAAGLVATYSTGYGLSVSGRRTAFVGQDPAQPSADPGLNVATGSTITSVAPAGGFAEGGNTVSLSGTRVLFATESGWRLRDLRPGGVATNPSFLSTAVSATLWGNYVAWLQPDGSVWRRDLSTNVAGTKLADATAETDGNIYGARVLAFGDYVAWRMETYGCTGEPEECSSVVTSGYRNAATMADATELPAGTEPVSLSGDGLVLGVMGPGPFSVALRDLGTGEDTPLPYVDGHPNVVRADSGNVAWINWKSVPSVAALPVHEAAAPRSLGNPVSQVTAAGVTPWAWSGEILTSAALTSCAVLIKSGATVVRTLTCNAAAAAQGTALVSWDGKNTAGTAAAAGTYTWTVQASNADGDLVNADGSSTAVTGQIALPASKPVVTKPALTKPTVTKQPVAKSVKAGTTAVFTAAATGNPTPTVQWQVRPGTTKKWANIAKATSTTLNVKSFKGQKGYAYRAVFTNKLGVVYTSAPALTVK